MSLTMSLLSIWRSLESCRFFRCSKLLLCLLALSFAPLFAADGLPNTTYQQEAQPTPLERGRAIERELRGGETHRYELKLEAGQFVDVAIEQLGINVRAILLRSDGANIVEADSHRGARGIELACAIADIAGRYELKIRSMRELAVPGKYRLMVTALRPATAQDRARMTAQTQQYDDGETLRRKTDAPSWQQAVEAYQSALATWRALGDWQREADVLAKLSDLFCLLLRPQESAEYGEQALAAYRALADRSGEAEALFALGQAYRMRHENVRAAEYYEQALQVSRQIDERYIAGLSLYWLSPFYNERGEKQRALACAEASVPLLQAAGERGHEGFAFLKIGYLHDALGERGKALAAYEQARALFRADNQPVLVAGALNETAQIYATQGESAQAVKAYQEALAMFRAIGNAHVEAPLGAGRALLALGQLAGLHGEKQQALDYYQQALSAYQSPNSYHGQATARRHLSEAYRLLGEWQQALDQSYQAWLDCHNSDDRSAEAGALADLAFVYLELGDGEQALALYEQAKQIYQALNDREGEARTLAFTGIAYNSIGEKQQAIECLKQAIALCQAVESRQREASALSVIAAIYETMGERQQAQAAYARSLALCRAVEDRHLEGSLLIALGYYAESRDRQQALEYYEQAAALYQRMGNRTGEASALIGLGKVAASFDQLAKAVELHGQAIQLARAAAEPREEAKAFFNLAQIERHAGQLSAAREHLEATLRLIESQRARVISPDLRASYMATTQEYFDAYTDLLMQLHRQNPTGGHEVEAFQSSERRRARSLLEVLDEARFGLRQGAPAELLARETSLQEQINGKLLTLKTAGQPAIQNDERNRKFNALTLELRQVRDEIHKAAPPLAEALPLSLAEIKRQLDANTLLLEYALGSERSYVWAVTADSIHVFDLPNRDKITKQARQLYRLLDDQQPQKAGETSEQWRARAGKARRQFPAAAAELSQTVLGPVAALLGDRRLLIVADGALQYIPFGALTDCGLKSYAVQSTNRKSQISNPQSFVPLIVDHEIVNLPSASTIAVLRRELEGRAPAPNSVVLLADPVFAEDDERLKHSTEKPAAGKPGVLATNDLIRSARDTGWLDAQGKLQRLPRTKVEAEAIAKSAAGKQPKLAMGFDASRQFAMSGALGQYRIIHFATHGLANSRRPELSGVVLSLFDREGRTQNGFLRLHDIYNLKLPADLVVLSACQTALGQEIRGEGLIGLTRGFMHAGAARVVASLWNVDDRATAELMKRFYEGMLGPKQLRPAAALRAAQVSMWRDGRWNQPYHWAAFVLQGEWR